MTRTAEERITVILKLRENRRRPTKRKQTSPPKNERVKLKHEILTKLTDVERQELLNTLLDL